jgi:hypothetical protein
VDILERNITADRARRWVVDPLWREKEKGYGQVGEEKGKGQWWGLTGTDLE